ncbi:uncharacterized protein CAH6 [Calliphora vicina]|uniref:uncharacterized protein CAH6 n=1 Tax=Calliphora vicina TaxID=7373 RepID=UPI00325AE42F
MVAGNQTLQKLFLLLPLALSRGPDWSYENPQSWGIESPQCNGNRQSPIHIRSTTSYILPIPPIKFGNYDIALAGNLNLTNNGHSVEFAVPLTTNGQRPFISGGLLRNKYEAEAVHFHWGSAGSKGSEHVIDNRRFDVEMHIVHRNVRYSTVEEAARNRDGLAVLGVMFKIVNVPDRIYPGLYRIFNQLPAIVNYQSFTSVVGRVSLGQMLGDLNTKQFFSYSGSLTTPNCAEAVTWHVFPGALPIAQEQIRKFWSLLDVNGNVVINNYRPLQNRNRRPVFYRIAGRSVIDHFNYDEPTEWFNEFPQCGGHKQSPIAITTHKTIDVIAPPILFGLYDAPMSQPLKMRNNGHTVEFNVPPTVLGDKPFITGGILDDIYEVEQVHFHWGSTLRKGSEHVLNGHQYDIEMHIVHRNKKYDNMKTAIHFEDGVTVVGVLFKVVKTDQVYYPGLNVVYSNLPNVQQFNSSSTAEELISLGSLLGNINREDFYTYQGSLTTPPCAESVTWVIFSDILPISYRELPKFWDVLDEHGKNFVNVRPIQNNGFRKIYHRKPLFRFKYFGWQK